MANNDENFPGFELQQRLFSILQAAAVDQGERMNRTWSKLGTGKYTFGDWMQDLSQGVSAHQEVMQRLARASAPESDQPTWVRLVWDDRTKPITTITLGRPLSGTPLPTKLAALGGISSGSHDLTLTWTPVKAGNRLNIEVTGNRPSAGHYIGLLVTSEMQQSPEVIVLLQVR